jgi:alkylation response protein AidB-like acyl-CoA dehydrogenase
MTTGTSSKINADKLIHWIRQYAPLHIDSHLADKHCCFPPHVLSDLASQGFFGIHITQKHGGLELKTFDILRVIEQVAAIDLTLSIILIEAIQGAHTLEKYASKSMKKQYLNLLASGHVFTAGAMTESEAGSNPRAMKSTAISDNERGWLLKGSKHWVGMGSSAHLIAIYVQQLDSNNNWLGISGFLVPKDAEGLCIGQDFPTIGVRGFSKNTITMDNIPVSAEHLLGKVGEGMEIAQDNMMYIRLCLAAASLGAMKRCVQFMYHYAEHRVIATGVLLENPVTLIRLSEMTAVIDALDNFIYLISSIYDENPAFVPEEAFVVSKILGSEYLGWVADLAVQLLGAKGYEQASDVSKIFRDARVFRIFEGPTEALNMYIGSRGLEKNANLENFISNTLNQKKLFESMKGHVDKINECCFTNKNRLFSKPFSINYWAQALVGDLIINGLFLAGIEYCLQKNNSESLQRASIWVRGKYDEIIQKVLAFSLGEQVVVQTNELRKFISPYANTIGNIDLSKRTFNSVNSFIKGENIDNIHPCKQTKLKTDVSCPAICVYHFFEQQVNTNPKSIALVYNDQYLSYESLNSQENKVAHYLKKEVI